MPSLPCVLLQINPPAVLNLHAMYPREDMGPVIGLDPNLEYCVKRTPFPEPDFDPRLFSLDVIGARGTEPDAEFPHLHPWNITFATVARTKPEIKNHIRNKEREQLSLHFAQADVTKKLLLIVAAIARDVKKFELTPDELAVLDEMTAVVVKVKTNDQHAAQLEQDVDADLPVDIDAGWVAPPAP